MKTQRSQHFSLLDELDARQDDVLCQLDALNSQIETLLGEFGARVPAPMAPQSATPSLAVITEPTFVESPAGTMP